jgi:FPC/CPF motif-containing protein YcgG
MNRQASRSSTADFRSRIEDPGFPCVGAKSALMQGNLDFIHAGDLRSARADVAIVRELQAFAESAALDAVFVTRVVLFESTPRLDEVLFERAMWQRLNAFHAIDCIDHAWDPSVSDDPQSPQFSLSIGGRAFYVVGLHPGSSRRTRQFRCTALVFNLHSQFESLRADGRYDKLREAITARDIAYSGSRNPMLAVHGVISEARQYSGREVDAEWRCPFSVHADETSDAA